MACIVAGSACASPPPPGQLGPLDHAIGPAAAPTSSAAPSPLSSASTVATPAGPTEAAEPASRACPEDMVDVAVACIDRFEAPNERGQKPLLMQSSEDGERWCEDRGKRLCTEDEWVRACQGPRRLAYPYGQRFESGRCNDEGTYRAVDWKTLGTWPSDAARAIVEKLDQSEPSGAREGCASAEGVFDLTGNAAEWVVRTKKNETNYSHVVKGCFWGRCFRVPHEPSCEYVNFAHPAGFRSYEMGFRCCKERTAPQ